MRIPSALVASLLLPLAGSLVTGCYDTDGFELDPSVFGGGGASGASGQAGSTSSQGGAGSSQGGAGTSGAGGAGQGGAAGSTAGDAGASGVAGQSGSAGESGSAGNGGDSGAAGESGSAGAAGVSGSAGTAGAAGIGGGGAGSPGVGGGSGAAGAGTGGVSGSSGQGGKAGTGGTGGAGAGGAGNAGTGGSAGCANPTNYYTDSDKDGFGAIGATATPLCTDPGEGWSTLNTDCNDKNVDVYPGQAEFFTTGYARPGAPGNVSFDYDCNGQEEGSPSAKTKDSCPSVLGIGCQGDSGFTKTSRSGTGANSYCGSMLIITCNPGALSCSTSSTQVTPSQAYACH